MYIYDNTCIGNVDIHVYMTILILGNVDSTCVYMTILVLGNVDSTCVYDDTCIRKR